MRHPLSEELYEEIFRQLSKRTLIKHAEFLLDLGAFLASLLNKVVPFELNFFQYLLLFVQNLLGLSVQSSLLFLMPLKQLVHIHNTALMLLGQMFGGCALTTAGWAKEDHMMTFCKVHQGRNFLHFVDEQFLNLPMQLCLLFVIQFFRFYASLQSFSFQALLVVLGDKVPEGSSRLADFSEDFLVILLHRLVFLGEL
jgi:hypothetical protein